MRDKPNGTRYTNSMGTMNIQIYGRDYTIACDDGQEAHLSKLAQMVNDRVRQLAQQMGRGTEALMLMYTALMLADEVEDLQNTNRALRHELQGIQEGGGIPDTRKLEEMEAAMASTMEQIAARIEKLAGKLDQPSTSE